MIAKQEKPAVKIQVPVSKESVREFPAQQGRSFILSMTGKASGATASPQNIFATLPLNNVAVSRVALQYLQISRTLISAIAFEFSRRYTCRPPPFFI